MLRAAAAAAAVSTTEQRRMQESSEGGAESVEAQKERVTGAASELQARMLTYADVC
jgi:hypothetical protein